MKWSYVTNEAEVLAKNIESTGQIEEVLQPFLAYNNLNLRLRLLTMSSELLKWVENTVSDTSLSSSLLPY